MKTKSEILKPYIIRDTGLHYISPRNAEKAMEEYATEQTAKWRELYEAMKEYRKLCKSEFESVWGMAYIHGWRAKEADIEKGEELRQKIAKIEEELGLKE